MTVTITSPAAGRVQLSIEEDNNNNNQGARVPGIPDSDEKQMLDFPTWQKWVLWTSVILTSYANGLDNFTMSVYLNTAASELNSTVQYATLAVIQSMILAAGKPVFAKLSDVLGRAAALLLSVLLLTAGTATIAASRRLGALAAGMVLFSCGNTGLSFTLSLLVSDLTSPRWRCTIGNLLAVHFLVNFAAASRITEALVPRHWRWGAGMFSVVNPCVTAPMMAVLGWQQYRSAAAGLISRYPYRGLGAARAAWRFCVDVDAGGLFCFAAGFLLLLLPLTIAERAPDGYATGYVVAMLVLGAALLLLAWPLVEMRLAARPMVDVRRFLTNANVVVPGAIVFADQFSVALTMTPAYQWISITHGWRPGAATLFLYTQSACLVLASILAGMAATYTGRYKRMCMAGACVRLVGLGLMMKYRAAGASTAQVVVPQVLMGLGGGLMTANVTVVAQAAVPHAELAVVTGFVLLVLELGAAIGSAVVGAVQQGGLRAGLHRHVDPLVGGNGTVADAIYAKGSLAAAAFPLGSPIRDAVVRAWSDNMHRLITAAIAMAAVNLVTCVALPDDELSDKQQNNVQHDRVGVLAPVATRAGEA